MYDNQSMFLLIIVQRLHRINQLIRFIASVQGAGGQFLCALPAAALVGAAEQANST